MYCIKLSHRANLTSKPEDYNALEERYLMQTSLIETLQRDHARLSNDIKYLEDENYKIQVLMSLIYLYHISIFLYLIISCCKPLTTIKVARDQEANTNQKQQSELVRLRKQLKDAKNQLNAKLDIASMYNKNAPPQKTDDKAKDSAVNDLKRKLADKEQSLSQKDRTIEDLQQKLNVTFIHNNHLTVYTGKR